MFNRSRFGLMHSLGLAGALLVAGIGTYVVVRMRSAKPRKIARAMKRDVKRVTKRHTNHTSHAQA